MAGDDVKKTVSVNINADASDANATIDEFADKLEGLDAEEVAPEVTLNHEEFDAEVDDVRAQVDELAAQAGEIRIGADDTVALAKMDELSERLVDLMAQAQAASELPFDIDDDEAEAKLTELQAQLAATKGMLEDLKGSVIDIDVEADTDEAQSRLALVQSALYALQDKLTTLRVQVGDVPELQGKLSAIEAQLDRLDAKVARPEVAIGGVPEAEAKLFALNAQLDAVDDESGAAASGLENVGESAGAASAGMVPLLGALAALAPALAAIGEFALVGGAGVAGFAIAAEKEMSGVEASVKKMVAAFQQQEGPVVLPAIQGALPVIQAALKDVEPLVGKVADAFMDLEQDALSALTGPGFQKWSDQIKAEWPQIDALIKSSGQDFKIFGSELIELSPSVIDDLNAIAKAAGLVGEAFEPIVQGNKIMMGLAHDVDSAAHSLGDFLGTNTQAAASADKSAEAMARQAKAAQQAVTPQQQLTNAMNNLAKAENSASTDLGTLNNNLATLEGNNLTAQQATLATNSAIVAFSDSVTQNGLALDQSSDAGIANNQALLAVGQAAIAMIGPMAQAGDNTTQIQAAMTNAAQAFDTAAAKTGYNTTQIQAMNKQLGLTPAQINTEISDSGAQQVINDANNVVAALAKIQNKTVTVTEYNAGISPQGTTPVAPSGYASGVLSAPGGQAVVGEDGPEVVDLPRGSTVRTNAASQMAMAGGQTGGDTINLHVHAPSAGPEAMLNEFVQAWRLLGH